MPRGHILCRAWLLLGFYHSVCPKYHQQNNLHVLYQENQRVVWAVGTLSGVRLQNIQKEVEDIEL